MFTRHDRHVALGDVKRPGDRVDQFVVGRTFDRRCLQADEQRAVARAGYARFVCARDHPDGEITSGVAAGRHATPGF